MRINKFVLDANIYVSYFLSKQENRLLEILHVWPITIYHCKELLDEVERVLDYPHIKAKYTVDTKKAIFLIKEFY
jgi:predicted nucleic acid-binding protein